MENTTNSNQTAGSSNPNLNPQFTGMPTKHSLLSAQADLNTNSFNKNPIPENLPHTTVSSPAVSSMAAPTASSVAPKPLQNITPVASAHSTSFSNTPIQTQTVKPNPTIQAYSPNFVHPSANNIPSGSGIAGSNHEVVFADSSDEVSTAAPTHAGRHLFILILSTLLIVGLLGGGLYYWYFFLGGKATLNNLMLPGSNNLVDQTSGSPVQNFPINNSASSTNTIKSQPVAPIKTSALKPTVNSSAFGTSETTSPKKVNTGSVTATFSSAEKEKITAYLSNNINRLSPVRSQDSYAVNDVKFDGPNRAIVSYSSSEYDIAAVANVYIDKYGSVKVSSFTILEK